MRERREKKRGKEREKEREGERREGYPRNNRDFQERVSMLEKPSCNWTDDERENKGLLKEREKKKEEERERERESASRRLLCLHCISEAANELGECLSDPEGTNSAIHLPLSSLS